MAAAVGGLAAQGCVLDLIVTSPLVRARQTADILAKGLPGHPRVTEASWLEPDVSPEDAAAGLARIVRASRVALVGHEPGLGALAGWLLAAAAPLPFKKGAVACYSPEVWPPDPPVTLAWFVTARMLRRPSRPSRRRSSAR